MDVYTILASAMHPLTSIVICAQRFIVLCCGSEDVPRFACEPLATHQIARLPLLQPDLPSRTGLYIGNGHHGC